MNYSFGYVRVSTDHQAESGLGLSAQRDAIQKYYDFRLKPLGFGWGGVYRDEGVSGSKPFRERKAGKILHDRLTDGDQVMVSRMDRAFRKASDFFFTLELWGPKKIGLHLIDIGLDTSSPQGTLMCQVMSAFAEFEKHLIRERTREALRQKREAGQPVNQYAGYGKQIIGRKGERQIVDDPYEQEVMQRIYEWKNNDSSWEEIYWHLLRNNIRVRGGRPWSIARIRACYAAESLRQEKLKAGNSTT